MILVDGRVGSVEVLPAISRLCGGKAKRESLDAGDFCFSGNGPDDTTVLVGIERKQIGDAITSIRSGRLAGDQLVKMSEYFDFCYLLIEGIYRPDPDTGILQVRRGSQWVDLKLGSQKFMYAELDHALTTFELRSNTMVRRSADMRETAFQVVDLWRYYQKPWDQHHAHEAIKSQGGVTLQKASLLRRWAAELPGVGWKRSKAVEVFFQNAYSMATSGVAAWEGVEGIGKTTAQKVVNAIRTCGR